MKKLTICSLMIFLLSCEISVNTEMYISDIIEYVKSKPQKELLLNCSVEFEVSSKDEYQKDPDKYNNILANAFYEAKDASISERDMKTILSAKGKIYFARENLPDKIVSADGTETSNEREKSLIYFTCDEDKQFINIYLNFEKNKYNQLNYTIKENTYQDLKLKDFHISIDIQNDMAEPCELTVYSSYVNNEPVLYSKPFTINKRETLNISLSTLFKDYSFQNGKECIIKIKK